MERVNEQKLARRGFVSGKGKTARRHNYTRRFPQFRPCAERLESARDSDLLRFVLSFAWRKVRANVHLESGQRFYGERRVIVIADFFECDDVGVELCKINMHRLDLAILFGA